MKDFKKIIVVLILIGIGVFYWNHQQDRSIDKIRERIVKIEERVWLVEHADSIAWAKITADSTWIDREKYKIIPDTRVDTIK